MRGGSPRWRAGGTGVWLLAMEGKVLAHDDCRVPEFVDGGIRMDSRRRPQEYHSAAFRCACSPEGEKELELQAACREAPL